MVNTTKNKISQILVFVYLVLFPFGQIFRFNLKVLDLVIPVQPIDLVAALSLPFCLLLKYKKPKVFKYIFSFLLAALFSYVLSLLIFRQKEVFFGGLYLLRLFTYVSFFLLAWNFAKNRKGIRNVLLKSLIAVSLILAFFGWIQYLFYPDIRSLTIWGWDDHLYRLVGTFLDPGFTSIILVFGFLICFLKFLENKKRKYIFPLLFLLMTIGFTYSRAGYLALLAGIFVVFLLKKRLRIFFIVLLILTLLIFLLPRPSSEGVKLERMFSIYARLENYSQTLLIIKKSPLFGVGFNNLCLARQKYLGKGEFGSHSCSGSDSSLLFVLATTGVIGFLLFIDIVYQLSKKIPVGFNRTLFIATSVALIVHSLFVGSMFYPWVMGWMGILLASSCF